MPEIMIDQSRRRVYWDGSELLLSPQEYRILDCLGRSAGEVVSKQALLAAMWSTAACSEDALISLNPTAVDLVIFRLRKKLGDDPRRPTYVETRRGFGYILYHARVIAGANRQAARASLAKKPAQASTVSPAASPAIAADPNTEPWSTLTRREWELFLLLGDETATRLTNKALAQSLHMAEGTLKKHLQNIYRKLGVENRSVAALLAMRVRGQLLLQETR